MSHMLLEMIKQKALIKGDFTLSSGSQSNYYFDMKKITSDPIGLMLIAKMFLKHIQDLNVKSIGGVFSGGIPIISAMAVLSAMTENPYQTCFVRKSIKDHGTKTQVEGYLPKGETVFLFEDVITTGKSVIEAIDAVESYGAHVSRVYAIIDRLEGADWNLRDRPLKLTSLFTMEDFS